MIPKKDPELIEVSIPMSFPKNIIPIQDKPNINLNQQFISSNITKKQKDFIIKTNKSFFYEFGKLYAKNILLKAKLNELLNEKKKLNQIILKKEDQINKENNDKKNDNNSNNTNNNNNTKNVVQYYKKRKRIRRKKNEIVYSYYCEFPNCNKSYPKKGSLNMHIKLKHNQDIAYNFGNEDIK